MEKREYGRYIKEKKFMKRLERQASRSYYSSDSRVHNVKWFIQTNIQYLQKLKTTSGYSKYSNWFGREKERKKRRNTEKMQHYKNLIDEIENERMPFRFF